MEGLRIYFRQHQLKDSDNGNINVVVDCGTVATYIPGNVPKPEWVDMTAFTDGLEKLVLSWDSINQGAANSATNPAGSNYDKGISLDLVFVGEAFNYIFDWLLSQKCQMLNSIDVRIDDMICGKSFRLFEIKCDNLKYKPEEGCRMQVKLREQDLVWHDIHKTFIWDDHQKWFNSDGTSVKAHPQFLTCIEPRPRLLNSVRVGLLLFIHGFPITFAIDTITDANIKDDFRRIAELNNFVPAPLIRDYIDNVAAKHGLSVDTIFHRDDTPEYYACIYHPTDGYMHENDDDSELSPSTQFLFENRWNVTIAELLDKLKPLYCAEWYVTPNNTIVFKPVYELENLLPIHDFTTGDLKIENLEYSFSGTKKAAYGRYQYQPDGSDLGSQEIGNLYNDIVDYDGPLGNPMLEGEKSKQFEFGSTSFVRDGRTKDYIRLLISDGIIVARILIALLAVISTALLWGTTSAPAGGVLLGLMFLWFSLAVLRGSEMLSAFTSNASNYTGAVRMVTGNQTLVPRILYWDGVNISRAKVIKTNDPAPNAYYNPEEIDYDVNNKISQDNPNHNIFNYQAFFDSKYKDNLFDRFHDKVDNPLKSLETNQSFEFTTDLCCSAMDILGLWENDFPKIGYIIKIESRNNYDVYGRIEHIETSYNDFVIKLKGKVIKR